MNAKVIRPDFKNHRKPAMSDFICQIFDLTLTRRIRADHNPFPAYRSSGIEQQSIRIPVRTCIPSKSRARGNTR